MLKRHERTESLSVPHGATRISPIICWKTLTLAFYKSTVAYLISEIEMETLPPGGIVAQWLPSRRPSCGWTRLIRLESCWDGCKTICHWLALPWAEPSTRRPSAQPWCLTDPHCSDLLRRGISITDDNQLLAYRWSFHPAAIDSPYLSASNHARILQAVQGKVPGR